MVEEDEQRDLEAATDCIYGRNAWGKSFSRALGRLLFSVSSRPENLRFQEERSLLHLAGLMKQSLMASGVGNSSPWSF